jgi:hypothetical protein
MATLTCCRGWPYRMRMCVERYATPSAGCPVSGVVCARRSRSRHSRGLAASMIVESCAKTWPVCHRSFVDWLAGLDDSLDISHIPALSDPGAGTRLQESTRVTTGIRETRRRAPPPVGPWPWPPPPVDRRYLRPPGECRVGVLEVERIAKKRPAERARASRRAF